MKSNELFNGLNGCKGIDRSEIIDIIELAKQENNTDVIYRLSKILNANPDVDIFNMEIRQFPETGLNGSRHTGDYKEALDECGRLNKGFRFKNGKVIKVTPKVKPVKKTASKTPKAKKTASNYGKKSKRTKTVIDLKNNKLQDFEINIITDALNKKFGLQSSIKKSFESKDKNALKTAIILLSKYTGMSETFLHLHIEEIISLPIVEETPAVEKYDFIFEVSHKGGYYIKTFLHLPTGKSVKFREISDNVKDLRYYDATEKGLEELKKIYKNSKYGDKNIFGVKDLLKRESIEFDETWNLDDLIKLHKDNYRNVDITSPKSDYEKKLEKLINQKFSLINKERAEKKASEKQTPTVKKVIPKPKTNDIQLKLLGTKKQKPALKSAVQEKEIAKPISSNPAVSKAGVRSVQNSEFYKVNGSTGEFLQRVEKKPKESVVITIDGEQGAGKTTMLYNYIEDFASAGNSSIFLTLEEHKDSELATEKVNKYLSQKAKNNLDMASDIDSIEAFYKIVACYDICFIDSWQKLLRLIGTIRLDEDLRKKFDGKVFVIIFQQTTTGRTKGGSEVVFDGDIIIKMVKENSFADNYAYFDKNRYTKIPIENIRYNIANRKVYNPNETNETQKEVQPKETIQFSFNTK